MDDREYIIQLITEAEPEEINLLADYLRSKERESKNASKLFNKSFD